MLKLSETKTLILLKTEDPSQIMTRMNSINGIRNLNKILSKTPDGKELFKNLKRMKLAEVVDNNMVDLKKGLNES